MLSNTATPIYYGLFRDKVIRGEIPDNQEISMEMNRIDELSSSYSMIRFQLPMCIQSSGALNKFIAGERFWH